MTSVDTTCMRLGRDGGAGSRRRRRRRGEL